MFGHPQDLGRGEPGQSLVTRDLYKPPAAYALADFIALLRRALVVPKYRRA
jgi:hypothetical protein